MLKEKYNRIWNSLLALELIGTMGHLMFFEVQENFYGKQNVLKPLYNNLGVFQLSMTSYFISLTIIGVGMLGMFFFLLCFEEMIHPKIVQSCFYLLPIAGAVVYTLYEINQSIHPTYPDRFALDACLSWLACLTYISVVRWAIGNNRTTMK